MVAKRQVALFNFDHGRNVPAKFRFGPFEIVVSASNVRSVARVARHARVTFTYDSAGNPIVQQEPARSGRAGATASVRRIDEGENRSLLFSEVPNADGFSDLSAILSFMTGRQVFLERDKTGYEARFHGEFLVGSNYFAHGLIEWPDLEQVVNRGLQAPFWALIQSNLTPDLIGQMCYASAVLDAISTEWFAAQPKAQDISPSLLKDARKRVGEVIRDALGEHPFADDVLPRVGNLFSPSALHKLESFLCANELFPDSPSPEEISRLRLLNTVRNRVVHSADVPTDLHPQFVRRGEIAAATLSVTKEICFIYFSALLGIRDFEIDASARVVRDFFKTGEFRGHRVFDEDYENFATRQKEAWIADSTII